MPKLSRKTRQKELLKSETEKIDTFFTADDLLKRIREKDEEIGIATIYRFLHDLKAKGEIHCYTCDGRVTYSNEKKNHCHFVCVKCGRLTHFDVDNIDFVKKKIAGEMCHFQIEVHGLCDNCLTKENVDHRHRMNSS
jgi:Fur family ferric uptake transcriptional regulator